MNTLADARSAKFLADLDRLDVRQANLQRQISSGYRVSLPSDSPEDLVDILQLKSDVARAGAIGQTLGRVQSEVNTAEASLQVATQLLERAHTVAAQAATSTFENRKGAALEIQGIQQQLVDLTKTLSSGRYVFSGDADQTPLYDVDPAQDAGVARHAQPTNSRSIQDINGTSFQVTRTAGQIFDTRDSLDKPDSTNVFNAVFQLSKALENDDQNAVVDASHLINASLEHLGQQLTFYGNSQNRVSNAIELANKATLQRTKELSELQDADLTQAIVELSTVKVHREATLGAQAQQPRTSLFNYLG